MFSGLPAGQLTAGWFHPFADHVPRVAEVLRDHGYVTAAFSANFSYAGPTSGLGDGFSEYLRRPLTWRRIARFAPPWQTPTGIRLWRAGTWPEMWDAMRRPNLAWRFFPAGRYWTAKEIANHFLYWQAAHAGRPFFAFLNFLDVHEHHSPGRIPPEVPMRVPDIRGYDEATLYVDSVVQALQDTLAARGLGDRTLLIVTADHGEQFREHGLTSHGNSLYMQLLRVPLLLRYPGKVPAGLRVGTLVSTRDLAATIADLTGTGNALPGVSLAETWRHPEAPREPALSEVEQDDTPQSTAPSAHGPMRALADSAWHYIQGPLGAEELYRYRDDPKEQQDLSRDPRNAEVLTRMRERLRGIPFRY
jgi:arylsulfatase A-like enzyme